MKRLLFVILLLLLNFALKAQKNKADENFRLYRYGQSIPLYEAYIADHPNDYAAAKNLAIAYQLTNDIPHATAAYQRLINLKEAVSDDLFQMIQMLRISENIAEAKRFAAQYQSKARGEKASNLII